MANVTLPTPVVLAGAGLCLLGGYLVGAVGGATDQVERRTAEVATYDATGQRVCLTGDAVSDLPGVDDEGRLCGSWRRTPSSAVPREGDTMRFVSVATAEQVDGKPRRSVVIIGDVVR